MVGSPVVSPSLSMPSSLTSLTSLVFPGLLPTAVKEFDINAVSTSAVLMV